MNSFEHLQRQLRLAIFTLAIVFPSGVLGYMIIEDLSTMEAIWLTVITLATVGYGDQVPQTDEGRIFTLFLIVIGLGAAALGAQAAVEVLVSPYVREVRQRVRADRKIRKLRQHYIICGETELVDRTINYLQRRAQTRRHNQRIAIASQLDDVLESYFGARKGGTRAILRQMLRYALLPIQYARNRGMTMLDILVVITQDQQFAQRLIQQNMLVILADPTDEDTLSRANINHARAMMVMMQYDVDTLLAVLAARSLNAQIYITAAALDRVISFKITRVGANNVLMPFDIAGQFLNNATLRPAVNEYFNNILFDHDASEQVVQLYLSEESAWVGRSLGELQLRERFQTGILGLRTDYGRYYYAPGDDYVFQPGDIVLAITPGPYIPGLQQDCCEGSGFIPDTPNWQRLPTRQHPLESKQTLTLREAEANIEKLHQHYIICGDSTTIHAALDHLNPEQPFVFVSGSQPMLTEMQRRGFHVVYGDPTHESTLERAGIEHALAIMIGLEDRGEEVLTTLNARSMNKEVLIVAAAQNESMSQRLRRAGADRVMSPLRIAAQFVLLATTRPIVSDFMQYVLYNYDAGIETTELYMQQDSPWIGQTIGTLRLGDEYRAFVIGVRQPDGTYIYAPPLTHVIQMHEVLIVITPMSHADTIRLTAHGGVSRRPRTLRY